MTRWLSRRRSSAVHLHRHCVLVAVQVSKPTGNMKAKYYLRMRWFRYAPKNMGLLNHRMR